MKDPPEPTLTLSEVERIAWEAFCAGMGAERVYGMATEKTYRMAFEDSDPGRRLRDLARNRETGEVPGGETR